jgi:hypothetical protein
MSPTKTKQRWPKIKTENIALDAEPVILDLDEGTSFKTFPWSIIRSCLLSYLEYLLLAHG